MFTLRRPKHIFQTVSINNTGGYGGSVTDTDQRVLIIQLTGADPENPGSQLNNLLSTFWIPSTFKVKAVNNDTAECQIPVLLFTHLSSWFGHASLNMATWFRSSFSKREEELNQETTSTSLVGRRVSLTGFISLVSSSSCSLISAKCWNPNRENIYQWEEELMGWGFYMIVYFPPNFLFSFYAVTLAIVGLD